jgi:DNA-directed RNA polymerase subunit RPC12/RpoP
MAQANWSRSLLVMNVNESQQQNRPDSWQPEMSFAALVRRVSEIKQDSPAYSICGTCGRRVEGTDKRKYCCRQCANRALLIRRRQARSRLVARLQA